MSRSSVPSTLASSSSSRSGTDARLGLIHITVAGLLWGTTGIVVQLLHQSTGLNPVSIGFYRLSIAAAVLIVVTARRLRDVIAAVGSAPQLLILIGSGLGAYQALYFLAVAMSGVAVATVVSLGLAPLLIAGWEALRAGRLPARITLYGLGAAITGLALITGFGAASTAVGPQPLVGLLAATGSGLGYAVTTVSSRHVSDRVNPLTLTTASTVTGALVLLPVAVLAGGIAFPTNLLPAGLLAYLGVVTTAVAYALFYAGLRTTAGSAAAVLTLLEPLTAALLAGLYK
ncbi:EamA family transporter [Micromonospora sp. WMMA1363]|uniref:DMT family transporter n=1 Tax=Micromonospora sp. WMMA1363 TaxID=3053985 RepID=UPI00259CBADD|nr:EamA family transporter [Micromonospora sp. WMMA1363]MDM4721557.1 EamA family transporter [Micromonospora sp. WMMA1363]